MKPVWKRGEREGAGDGAFQYVASRAARTPDHHATTEVAQARSAERVSCQLEFSSRGPADNRTKHRAGSIIASKSVLAHAAAVVSDERCHLLTVKRIIVSKSILAHAAAVVNDERCHLLFCHVCKCEQTANKVSTKNASVTW